MFPCSMDSGIVLGMQIILQAAFRSQYHEAFQKTQEHMANLFPPVDVDE